MHPINWLIVGVYVLWVVVDGIRKSKNTDTVSGYFLANKSLSWWVVGLSVMATQLSAVTMIGTPGQGATDGMRFIQLYLGLPLAMVILGVTIVPLLHGSGVFTAYEYLERRFDARTRSLTAFLFLISRGLSAGAIMAAPGVVFSAVFGIPLVWAVALIGVPTVIYTMIGGVSSSRVGGREADDPDRYRARRDHDRDHRADARESRRSASNRGGDRPAQGVRLLVRPERAVHVSGRA